MADAPMNRQILLVSRPEREASTANFRLVETPLAPLKDGELRVRNHYLSLDPYMRGRPYERRQVVRRAAAAQRSDDRRGTVGEVVESKNASYKVGDNVVGMLGWQDFGTSDGKGLIKVDTAHVPLSAYLGAVGMPGVTAWYGLNRIIAPKAGETVAVSAASGAVGSVVGQLAKAAGCRAIGLAGGEEKCRYVVETLGFDACGDYKAGRLRDDLKAAAPNGIDGYFENVGGDVLNAVLARMNAFGRIALCGLISGYDGAMLPIDAPRIFLNQRLLLQGFIVSEHMEVWPQALKELGERVATNKLHFRESVAQGLWKMHTKRFSACCAGKTSASNW